MARQDGPSSVASRRVGRLPFLVRQPGQRCDFCGSLTPTAVALGRTAQGTVICPSCVERAATEVDRPGGGDAA
ncbi:MAG TPA: hypothetical protein VI138_06650 [Candidatus Dormibacteraeota bacterium]